MSRGTAAGPSSSRKLEPLRGPFSEDQFLAVCREGARPREGAGGSWQVMAESAAFSIYRLFDEKSGLYEYKVYSFLPDCSPELCADVYMDLNFRKKWDPYLIVFMAYFDDPGGKVPSWLVNWATKRILQPENSKLATNATQGHWDSV